MSPEEDTLISQYFTEQEALKGTKPQSIAARGYELAAALKILHGVGGRLDTITTAQALEVVKKARKAYPSKNYTRRVIVTFKSFLVWYMDNGGILDPKKIRPIKAPGMDWDVKKNEDLLTLDEVKVVVEACSNSRDRAIISMLYDGSFRPGELLVMNWQDLIRDDYGIRMEFKTPKTDKIRYIRLTYSVPFLNAWEQDYPGEREDTSPLFVQTVQHSHQYKPLTKYGVQMLIRRLKKKTGIDKLSPSIFRPSKITHDVDAEVDRSYICMKNWGTLNTPMIGVYAKPGKDFVDKIALKNAGMDIKVDKKTQDLLKPILCPKCKTLNRAGAWWCVSCRSALSEEAKRSLKTKESVVMASPEYQALDRDYKALEERVLKMERMLAEK